MGVVVDFVKVKQHRDGALANFAAALDMEPRYQDILIGFGSRLLDRAATLSRGDCTGIAETPGLQAQRSGDRI